MYFALPSFLKSILLIAFPRINELGGSAARALSPEVGRYPALVSRVSLPEKIGEIAVQGPQADKKWQVTDEAPAPADKWPLGTGEPMKRQLQFSRPLQARQKHHTSVHCAHTRAQT